MFYELESSPYAQKSAATAVASSSKAKMPSPQPTESPQRLNNTSNTNVQKTILNGIGFTSDKVYRPQLPPDRLLNGNVSSSNGNGNKSDSPSTSTSESDSDGDNLVMDSSTAVPPKDSDISSTSQLEPKTPPQNKNVSPVSSPNVSTSVSSMSSPDMSPKKSKNTVSSPTATKSLVPYETDDTTSSDDSNQSTHEIESRVSTQAAVGEWQVTSSTDVAHELSSEGKQLKMFTKFTVAETSFVT